MSFPELLHLNTNVNPVAREITISDVGVSSDKSAYSCRRYFVPSIEMYPGHNMKKLGGSVWLLLALSSKSLQHAEAMAQDFLALATIQKAEDTA